MRIYKVLLIQILVSFSSYDCKQVQHYDNIPLQFQVVQEQHFLDENLLHFSYLYFKHRLWVLVRTASVRRF